MNSEHKLVSWKVELWLNESELSKLDYSGYWNDEIQEEKKEWYILDGDFQKMENYLEESGLLNQLKECIAILKSSCKRDLNGIGLDVAAGNCWASSYIFQSGNVEKLLCVEYSKHRILKIAPKVLEHYNIPKEKIVLILGNFYNLQLSDQSIDFVVLSQSLHHAKYPERLMLEIRRVLKPEGVVIIMGEHLITARAIAKKYLKHFKSVVKKIHYHVKTNERIVSELKKILFPPIRYMFPPDYVLGDHYYTNWQYKSLFIKLGFRVKFMGRDSQGYTSFLLVKNKIQYNK